MPSFTIQNASNIPLNALQGTVPNMSATLNDWLQSITFTQVTKANVGFQVTETPLDISFFGVIQPFTPEQLNILPLGERSWQWYWLHAQIPCSLDPDDVGTWLGLQMRVMTKKNYSLYGYYEYTLVEDYRGSGPPVP